MRVAVLALGTLVYWVAFFIVLVYVLQDRSDSSLPVTLGFLVFPLYALTTWGYVSLLRGSATVGETRKGRWILILCLLALFGQTAFLLVRPDKPDRNTNAVPM